MRSEKGLLEIYTGERGRIGMLGPQIKHWVHPVSHLVRSVIVKPEY